MRVIILYKTVTKKQKQLPIVLPAIKHSRKKQTHLVKKITKTSNALRFLRSKKLMSLTLRLRREARLIRFRRCQRHLL